MKHTIIDASQFELEEKVVSIKRVTKVVKGGRNFRFTALVVVGDGNGHVGAGLGKAAEIPEAIRKGKEDAMKKMIEITFDENGSITHDVLGIRLTRTRTLAHGASCCDFRLTKERGAADGAVVIRPEDLQEFTNNG